MRDYQIILEAWLSRKSPESKWNFEICSISIPCATFLALSTELYFKVLLSQVHGSRYKGHDLWKLYNFIPEKYKNELEGFYNRQVDLMPKDTVVDKIRVGFDGGDDNTSEYIDKSLEAVLKRNRKSFEEWRYVHERFLKQGSLTIELASIANVAVSLKNMTSEGSSRGKLVGSLPYGGGQVIA